MDGPLDNEQPDDSEQFCSEKKSSLPPGSTILCITFISFEFFTSQKSNKESHDFKIIVGMLLKN